MKKFHIFDIRMGVPFSTTALNSNYPFSVAADGEPGTPVPPPTLTHANPAPQPNEYVSRAELAAVAAERDRIKSAHEQALTKLTELGVKSTAYDSVINNIGDPEKVASELAELRKFKTDTELAGKTALEKMEAGILAEQYARKRESENYQKTLSKTAEEHAKASEAANAKITALLQYKLTAEIQRTAAEVGAANPEQIVRMLSADFKLNDAEDFVYNTTTDKGTPVAMTIVERVKAFLAEESNANLLAPSAAVPRKKAPGDTGASGTPQGAAGKDTYLARLGRALTDAEINDMRNHGKTQEEIAMTIVIAADARKRHEEAKKARPADRLPGEVKYMS